MLPEELKQNVTVYGPLFPEPVQIIIAVPMGSSVKLIGKGVRSSTVYEPILSAEQLTQLSRAVGIDPTALRLHLYPWIIWRESRNSASGHLRVRTFRCGRVSSVPRDRAFRSRGKFW
jgi:hypothetical protein